MTTDIILIILGLLIIFVSYRVSEKVVGEKESTELTENIPSLDRLVEENEKEFRKKMDHMFANKAEEEMIKVDDQLSHISNEKIMAVSEFSDQVLEKIEQNHKEVVFLYNMLNEKENEMKDFVQEIDKSKVVLEELAAKEMEKQKALQQRKMQKQLVEKNRIQQELEKEKEELARARMEAEKMAKLEAERKLAAKKLQEEQAMTALEALQDTPDETKNAFKQEEEIIPMQQKEEEKNAVEPISAAIGENNNQRILELYKEGKSIMEIAKLLGKGQGEVKLVIDLFQGANA